MTNDELVEVWRDSRYVICSSMKRYPLIGIIDEIEFSEDGMRGRLKPVYSGNTPRFLFADEIELLSDEDVKLVEQHLTSTRF